MPSGIPKPDFQYTADPANEKSKKEDVSEMLAKLRKQMPGTPYAGLAREKRCQPRRWGAVPCRVKPFLISSPIPLTADDQCVPPPGSKFNLFDRESMAKMAGKFQPGQRYTDPQAFERFKEQAADNMGQAEAGEARRKKARAAPAQAEDEGGEDVSTGSSDGGEETAAEL